MKYYKSIIIMMYLLGSAVATAQTQIPEIVIDPESGLLVNTQTYDVKARDKITIKPGISYKPSSSNNKFKASVDEKIVLPLITVSQMTQSLRTSLNLDKEVGSSSGSVEVSETGQMSYSMPIAVPPGTSNMQPTIAISHNSSMTDGLLGYKFSLSGLSSISRGYKQALYDNTNEVIHFNDNDPFYYNGMRLFAFSGSNGHDATTYKTEQENHMLITSHGNGSGPQWFTVRDKEGRTIEYGNSDDSKITGLSGIIFQWNISRIIDANGNYINYKYKTVGNQVVIDKIEYTGNTQTGLQPYNIIEFYYSSKPNFHTKYIADIPLDNIAILRQIKVVSESTTLRTYNFDYGMDVTPKLIEVTETGRNQISYNTTQFIWNTANATATVTTLNSLNEKWPLMAIGDFDGDGFDDRLFFNYTTEKSFNLVMGNPNTNNVYTLTIDNYDKNISTLSILDEEYDGKDELIISNRMSTTETVINFTTYKLKWLATSNTFSVVATNNLTANIDGRFYNPRISYVPLFINIQENTTPHILSLATATYLFEKPYTSVKAITSNLDNKLPNLLKSTFSHEVKFSDLDGDGNTEIIQVINTTPNECRVLVYKFDNAVDRYEPIFDQDYIRFNYMVLADFNGDGQVDMLTHQAHTNWMLHLFSGTSFLSPDPVQELNNLLPNHTSIVVGEYNGDNMADILVNVPSNETYEDGLLRLLRSILNNNPTTSQFNTIKNDIQHTVNWYKNKIRNEENIEHWSLRLDILNIMANAYGYLQLSDAWTIFRSGQSVSKSPEFNALFNFWGVSNNDVLDFSNKLNSISHPNGINPFSHNPTMYILASNGKSFTLLPGSINIAGFTSVHDCMVADLSGNGKPDLYFLRLKEDFTTRFEIARINHSESDPSNNINTIVDGRNIKHVFQYRYTHQYDFGTAVFTEAGLNPNINRLSPLRSPLQVVFTYRMGNVGCSTSDCEWKKSYKYSYGLMHRYGKGFLGFYNTSITTQYVMQEDMIELRLNSFNINRDLLLPLSHSTSIGTSNIILQTNSWEYDQNLLNQQSLFYKLQLLKNESHDVIKNIKSITEFKSYDNWGNPTQIENSHAGSVHKTIVDLTYTQTPNAFCPNRVQTETTTYQKGSSSKQLRTAFSYYANGNLHTKISFDNLTDKLTETYAYNSYGLPTSISISDNSSTRTTSFSYDPMYRFIHITTKPYNMITEHTYDWWGNVLWQKDEQGRISEYIYNGMGRLISQKDPLGHFTLHAIAWTHSSSNESRFTQTVSSPYSKPETITYNNLGRKFNETKLNSLNQTLIQTYIYETGNNPRHLLKQINKFHLQGSSNPRTTAYTYDAMNRVTQTNDEGRITDIQYHSSTNGYCVQTTLVNSDNNALNKVLWECLDKDGRVKEVNDRGEVVTYKYDEFGNANEITAAGATTHITSDDYGRQHTLKDANTGVYTYEYFAGGLLKKQTDPTAVVTNMQYDQLGRTTQRTRTSGSVTETTTYTYVQTGNGKGQLQTVNNGSTIETFTYDAMGRTISILENINNQTFTTTFEYNNLSRESKLTYPGGFELLKTYTDEGLLNTITDATTNTIIWHAASRNLYDMHTQINYTGDMQHIYEYKPDLTLLRNGIRKNGNYLTRMEYDFNFENGNLKLRKDMIRNLTETFEYDVNERLEKIYLNNTLQVEMGYTGNGNIRTKPDIHDPISGQYNYSVSAPHALTSIANTTVTIPAFIGNQQVNMNMAQRAALITKNVSSNTILKLSLTYGADDERRYAVTSNETTVDNNTTVTIQKEHYYLGHYEKIVANGTTKEIHYISAENGLFAVMIRTGTTQQFYYTYTDHLGSVQDLIQTNGTIAESYSFDSWGRRRNPTNWSYTNITNPTILTRGFTGHEHLDEFGLINMNARLYDPFVGRMLSPDNYVQDPNNVQNYNRYSYCWNNPLKYTDPDGNFVHLIVGAVIGGTFNWMLNGAKWNKEGLMYFGVGALAGALGAGVGAGISSAIAGGSFGAGFVGSSTAMAASSSFVSGAAIGGGTGFSSGFVTGTGNSLVQGQNFSDALRSGVKSGLIAGASGAVLGGLVGGYDAYRNNRNFWTGKLPEGGDNSIWGEITIKARGLGDGSSSTDGHSWIELKDANGNTTSYGTWGNQGDQEFLTNFRGDLGTHTDALQTQKITVAQKARFDNFISKGSNTNWTVLRNCSSFSSRAFNYTTGLNVMAHPFMIPIYTPSWLVRTILH